MPPRPLVSVVIPAKNYARFLDTAIRSVLAQQWPALEIIVVDDGSTDNTLEVAASFGSAVRCCRRETSGGVAVARNLGLSQARGKFIAFLDSDDAWLPAQLPARVERLLGPPQPDGVFGLVAQVDEEFFADALANPAPWIPRAVPGQLIGSFIFHRESFDRVGPFNEAFSTGEILEWMSRSREKGLRFEPHPELFLLRRIHGANTMLTTPKIALNFTRILKQHLDRRRASERNP